MPLPSLRSFFRHTRRGDALEWVFLVGGLLLFSAALLLPLALERSRLIEQEGSRLTASAQIIEQSLDRSLFGINRSLDVVRDQLPLWQQQPDMQARATSQLKAFADAMPGVRAMFILDDQGNGVAMGAFGIPQIPAAAVHKNFSHMPYFQALWQHPDALTLYVSEPYRTDNGQFWAVNLSRAVVGPDGRLQALVAAVINIEELALMLEATRYVDDQYNVIVHGNGPLVHISPMNAKALGMDLSVPGTFFSKHLEMHQASSLYQGMTPNFPGELLLAARTVQPPSLHMDHPLVIGVSRRTDAILADWQDRLRLRLFSLAAIWAVGLGVLWRWQRSRRMAQAETQAKTRQIEMVFESAHSLLAILDPTGRCLRLSAAWRAVMGWPVELLQQRRVMLEFAHPEDVAKVKLAQRSLDSTGLVQDFECRLRDAQDQYHDIRMQAHVLQGLSYLNAQDVTKERQQQQALQQLNDQLSQANTQLQDKEALLTQMAQHDTLTQLANRRRFDEEFSEQWRHCRRAHLPLSVLMIDVDHFKAYNDNHGHLAGDASLQAVAQAMRACCAARPLDLLARYGGEEFVALLPDTTAEGAWQVAQKLREAVLDLHIPHGFSSAAAQVTVSVGLACTIPDEQTLPTALLKAADEALYRAKAQGRNQVCGPPDSDTPQV